MRCILVVGLAATLALANWTPAPPTTLPPPPPPPPACDDCHDIPDPEEPLAPRGACCFGDKCIGTNKTQNACEVLGYVWAGAWTDCTKCRHLSPCCLPPDYVPCDWDNSTSGAYKPRIFGDYQCTHEVCFDCVQKGGTRVEWCDECSDLTTTVAITTQPPRTKPHKPTPAPTPAPTPEHNAGACCHSDGQCVDAQTAWNCNACNGTYRGDFTTCGDDNAICAPKCCDPRANVCLEAASADECVEANGIFLGYGGCSDQNVDCGGRCCVEAHAVTAANAEECEHRKGTNFAAGEPNDDEACPRACCYDKRPNDNDERFKTCRLTSPEDCAEVYGGQANAPGVACHPYNCGGACCQENGDCVWAEFNYNPQCLECTSTAEENCDSVYSGIWQGYGTDCAIDTDGDHEPEPNGQCKNDAACCIPPWVAIDVLHITVNSAADLCITAPDLATCQKEGGIYQGIGVACGDDGLSCTNRACCTGRGCINIDSENAELECKLKKGVLQPFGTNCDLPGVCDANSGACCCDGHCLNLPDSDTCRDFGGISFRGHGTSCDRDGICDIPRKEGACCIKQSYLKEGDDLCEATPNAQSCVFRGGAWKGQGTSCFDDEGACRELTGVCCVEGSAYDDLTVEECRDCGGHWAGPGSLSGDEGVCDPRHKGACCKKGRGCEETTYVQCKRDGGNFQGPETSCHDEDACAYCLPCGIDGQYCDYDADCPSGTVCVQKFNKCFAPATRIPSLNDNQKPPHWKHNRKRGAPPPPAPPGNNHGHHGDDDDDGGSEWQTWHNPNTGPFTCGGNETLGMPCILHPCSGKCAVGTCQTPPAGYLSAACESVCMKIHEYDCDCECKDPWWQTCAYISGQIVNDTNVNGQIDDNEPGIEGVLVKLFLIDPNAEEPEYIAEQTTGANGHYAFTGLAGGKYSIEVEAPEHYRVENSDTQTASVQCLPEGETAASVAVVHSQLLTVHHRELSNHIAENVNFLLAPARRGDHDRDRDHDRDHDHDHDRDRHRGGGGLSGAAIAGIIVGVLVLFICLIVLAVLMGGQSGSRIRRY